MAVQVGDQLLGIPTANLSLPISVLALLVSSASVAVSIHVARRDRSLIRLDLATVEIDAGPRKVTNMVALRVMNRGRRPFTLTSCGLEFSRGEIATFQPLPAMPLPDDIGEDQAYTAFAALRDLQEELQREGPETRVTALFATTPSGRELRRRVSRWSACQAVLRSSTLAPPPTDLEVLGAAQVKHLPMRLGKSLLEPTRPRIAPRGPTEGLTVETAQGPTQTKRPWWHFWQA